MEGTQPSAAGGDGAPTATLGVGDDGHRARMIEALRAEDTDGAGS